MKINTSNTKQKKKPKKNGSPHLEMSQKCLEKVCTFHSKQKRKYEHYKLI